MALIHSFEKSGSVLFKYRGQIPVILFFVAIPIIYFTDYNRIEDSLERAIKILAILISLSGLVIRGITIGTAAPKTSGRNTDKQVAEALNQSGIYSVVRHPLYLGNYLMWAGITMYVLHFWFFLVVSLLYWIYYERIMFTEERFLENRFGIAFLDWSKRVPAFIPSFKNYRKSSNHFSIKRVLSKEYSGFLNLVLSFAFIQTLQDLFYYDRFVVNKPVIIITGIALVIALLLRTLSKTVWKQYRNE